MVGERAVGQVDADRHWPGQVHDLGREVDLEPDQTVVQEAVRTKASLLECEVAGQVKTAATLSWTQKTDRCRM